MPWIRTIWILTMRPQRPTCIHSGMRVVHHDEVGLPLTFNTLSINTRAATHTGSERAVDLYGVRPKVPRSAGAAAHARP
eukprot:scaffold62050_cov82-Phaeocystis_antarctica.AAC.1